MKKLLLSAALFFLAVPAATAQSFDSIDECVNLKKVVSQAVSEAKPIDDLLTDNSITAEKYLEELYSAVQILSKSGETFFRAADLYESSCETALKNANHIAEMRNVYDWYLEPVKQAYSFFARARAQAIRLGRQKDVETFIKAMREYEDSILKIAAQCESTLAGTDAATSCRTLSSKLEDAVK